jgi:hypothetical protein
LRLGPKPGRRIDRGRPILVFFPFASANVRRGDGFSRVFAHCEVESFVELMLRRILRPGLDSEREAIRHAEKKQRKQKRRDFFYQDGLSGSGPLG